MVQDAWARGAGDLVVHGWFYGLYNGLLEDLKMDGFQDPIRCAMRTSRRSPQYMRDAVRLGRLPARGMP